MGNKIITEKDFWKCSCGAVPAQFQSTQKTVKKKSGEKFITVRDTATSSWIDFGCTRLMLIYAIIAAAVVVIAAMTVATGGAALIALGALAGLAGAAWGAIVGSLLCGQVAAKARKWVGSKKNYIVQGVETITGDHQMTCPVGGTITYAPEIKSWSQAISLGAANYIGHLMEGMMAGAAIGMGGAAISGGASAFASGGMRGVGQAALQFAKSAPVNVLRNIGATFGYAGAGASTTAVYSTIGSAIGLRSLTATQAGLQHFGETGQSGWGAAGKGAFGMETGMYHSVDNLTTFHNPKTGAFEWQGSWQDVAGLALLLSPVHKAPEELKGKEGEPVKDGEQPKDGETVKDLNVQKEEAPKKGEDGEAYEDGASGNPILEYKPGDVIAGKPVVNVIEGTNGTVAVIGRKMAGHVEDVGANLKSNGKSVELFNEQSQSNKLFNIDGETYTWKEVVDDFSDKSKYVRNEKGWIVDSDLPNSLMYKANKAWAEKLVNEKYTVVDMGYPPDVQSNSVFYDMELNTIFGK